MGWFDIIVYVMVGALVIIVSFISLMVWLINEGFKSKYKDEQEAFQEKRNLGGMCNLK
jgi:hypothetical protein